MSKADTFEAALLDHIFLNADIPNIGDATGLRGSTTPGSLYLSLHTADPGEAGTQATNEIAYTGYARMAMPRSAVGFTRTGNSIAPTSNVDFGACTAGTGTVTHFGIGVAVSGATALLYKGTVTPNIAVAPGVIPRITSAVSSITED